MPLDVVNCQLFFLGNQCFALFALFLDLMSDYCERSVFEALVNALIHRDYLILGSEVHIDIYDDRLTIYSPGGMADGTRIQERDLSSISSTRRNPILADIFGRLGYMERQGSGFGKGKYKFIPPKE